MPLITSTITPWPPPHLKKQSLHNTPDTPQITANTRWCSKLKKKGTNIIMVIASSFIEPLSERMLL